MHFVIIGTPSDQRVALFQQALIKRDLAPAHVVAYADFISHQTHLSEVVRPDSVVRIESPGRDFEIERLLVAQCDPSAADQMTFEKGRIWHPQLWYQGFRRVLSLIAGQLLECPPHHLMNAPSTIATMFDKPACHSLFETHDLPVPKALPAITSYDLLLDAMWQHKIFRVFVKLAHGSSASGAVAYQWQGDRHRAITTVEMVTRRGAVHLYNTRRIRTYDDPAQIGILINTLCRHRIHVEHWIPKSAHHNKLFDLRVVMIGGEVRHAVARLSHSPMTNLHLLNERAPLTDLAIPPAAWEAAQATCKRAATLFPNSLYSGIDLMFDSSYRRHYIVEINAFGDLLQGVEDRGQSTYDAEIEAILERARC